MDFVKVGDSVQLMCGPDDSFVALGATELSDCTSACSRLVKKVGDCCASRCLSEKTPFLQFVQVMPL